MRVTLGVDSNRLNSKTLMTRKRKTEAQRRADRDDAVRQAWQYFRPQLEAVRSYVDAQRLVNDAPIESAPGRQFYSNLGFFLQSFARPGGASSAECALYLALLPHLEAEGAIKPDDRRLLEAELRASLEHDPPSVWPTV